MKAYVLMADIIESSSYSGNKLMTDFKALVDQVNTKFATNISSPLTITLGDEFQGIIKDLNSAVQVVFAMDELLLKRSINYKLRYVINYGKIDTPINKTSSHEMLGEGLTKARKLLEELKITDAKIVVKGLENKMQVKLNLAFVLYRSLYDDWHEKDKKSAYDFLQNIDYKELARINKKAVSTMWRKKKSLKIEDFKASKELINLLANEG